MKIKAAKNAAYDKKTNTLTASLSTDSGEDITIQFDGVAFVNLMGMANLQNSLVRNITAGQEIHAYQVTGINTGHHVGPKKEAQFLLSLLVQGMGILNFALPAPVEMALREKMKYQTQ